METLASLIAATLVMLTVMLGLRTKGVFRDDGDYEEWCSELHPTWRGLAMSVFRCVHCKQAEDEDYKEGDNEDYKDYENINCNALEFTNEDGSINTEWLWSYICRKEERDHKKDALIAQQSEYIERLLHREKMRSDIKRW